MGTPAAISVKPQRKTEQKTQRSQREKRGRKETRNEIEGVAMATLICFSVFFATFLFSLRPLRRRFWVLIEMTDTAR
jgi:hypothetical protein